jgi:hypothetical protein
VITTLIHEWLKNENEKFNLMCTQNKIQYLQLNKKENTMKIDVILMCIFKSNMCKWI